MGSGSLTRSCPYTGIGLLFRFYHERLSLGAEKNLVKPNVHSQ